MHNWYCESTIFRIDALWNVDIFFVAHFIRLAMGVPCVRELYPLAIIMRRHCAHIAVRAARRVRSKVKRWCVSLYVDECVPRCVRLRP